MVTQISFLSDIDTPVSLFHKVSEAEPTACLLESTDGDSRLARYSVIGIFPVETVQFKQGITTIRCGLTGKETQEPLNNPLVVLQERLALHQDRFKTETPLPHLAFSGGWIGYMGYGANRYFDTISQQEANPLDVPEGYYGLYDTVILYDHLYRQITFLSYRPKAEALQLWDTIQARLQNTKPFAPLYPATDLPEEAIFDDVTGPFTHESFCERVEDAKKLVLSGEVFQIVLAQRFSKAITCDGLTVYRMLQSINPSPYSYFLKFPGFSYLGSSPETFVRCHEGEVVLRALAGTRPRGHSDEEDLRLAEELRSNEKELAEHHMLVDLGRNDLGRVSKVGSIQVGEIATLTRYTHVMHLATELKGQLRDDKTAYEVFQSCFPRGTVSGAPKIRAMEHLAKLEPEQRGVYAGVVGYFDHQGNMDGAIAIRSALIKDGWAHVQAGAGVVFDSTPEGEYQETRNKAKSTLKAVQLAQRSQDHVNRHH